MSDALRDDLHLLLDRLPAEALPRVHEVMAAEAEGVEAFGDLDPAERERLHAALEQSEREIAAGQTISAEVVIQELRSRR